MTEAMKWHPDRQPPEKRDEVGGCLEPVTVLAQISMQQVEKVKELVLSCIAQCTVVPSSPDYLVFSVV